MKIPIVRQFVRCETLPHNPECVNMRDSRKNLLRFPIVVVSVPEGTSAMFQGIKCRTIAGFSMQMEYGEIVLNIIRSHRTLDLSQKG